MNKFKTCNHFSTELKGCVLLEAWISNRFYTVLGKDGREVAPLDSLSCIDDNEGRGMFTARNCPYYTHGDGIKAKKLGIGNHILNKDKEPLRREPRRREGERNYW